MPDEASLPLGDLPPADPTVLVEPPLELAVAEIRFLGSGTVLDAARALVLREAFKSAGHDLVRMEQVRQGRFEFNLQQGAELESRVQEVAHGWQYQDSQNHLQVTVLPEALTVQTTRYERWSTSMRPLLQGALTAVRDVVGPAGVARIGLRYIDRFTDASAQDPSAWRGRIHDSLLGPACHPVFGTLVISAQQQVELSFGPSTGSLLRHGPFSDAAEGGAVSYLLDIDVYDTEPQAFDVNEIVLRTQRLNRTAYSLFHSSLTPEYLQDLGARTLSASDAAAQDDSSEHNDTRGHR